MKEASDAQLQIDSLKEHLALIRSDLTDELGLPAKLFNKLLKTYHKQTYGEEVKQAEEFQETYEAIFERK